jgi:hypothetical protein
MRVGAMLLAVLLVGCMDGDPSVGSSTWAEEVVTDCWIAGDGAIDPDGTGELDVFEGEVRHTGATEDATGNWEHTTSMGDRFVATPTWMQCRANGGFGPGDPPGSTANLSDFRGTGRWNGMPGYTFRVHGEDRGAGGDVGNDFYSITVFNPGGTLHYFAGGSTESGNYEIYPPDYVPPSPSPGECRRGHRGHGRGHYDHGRGHGYGHDRHHDDCDD